MRNNNWLSTLTSGVVVLCALTLTALVVRREFAASQPQPQRQTITEWRQYAAHGQRAGGADAPVTVVVFSDFQCPACRLLADNLGTLRAKYPGRIAVVYRHFPLPNHPFAMAAAQASECAAQQGRFEAYHNALFREQNAIGDTSWTRFAARAGVPDLASFERCTSETQRSAALARDLTDAKRLGVMATPTLLINGLRLDGTPPFNTLEGYIQRAVQD
jgi:protein-disulfide isomerase